MIEGSACEKKIADTECGERMREKKKIKTLYINIFETPDRPPLAAATGIALGTSGPTECLPE